MFQFIVPIAMLFGGGLVAKKFFGKKTSPAASTSSSSSPAEGGAPSVSSQRVDEFLELRSDGLYQFNRSTAVAILGWFGSVQAKTAPSGYEGVVAYDLIASQDGSPPPAGTGAGKILLAECKAGKTVLATRDITHAGSMLRRAAVTGGDLSKLAGKGGSYAILIVPSAESVDPVLPPMPGFEGARKPVPGAVPLPEQKASGSRTAIASTSGTREDAELPPEIRSMIDDLLKKPNATAEDLEAIGKQLRLGGFPKNAAMMETKAADMRAKAAVELVESRMAFVIPMGHKGATALAKKLTGEAARAKELLEHNPNLTVKGDKVRPWLPGQIVKLPPSWGA